MKEIYLDKYKTVLNRIRISNVPGGEERLDQEFKAYVPKIEEVIESLCSASSIVDNSLTCLDAYQS